MLANQDSFRPFYSFEKSEDGKIGKTVRTLLALLTVAYVYYMYRNAEIITDVKDIGIQSHDDIIKWGRNYINFNFTATKDNVITYESFNDETEDAVQEPSGQSNQSKNTPGKAFNATSSDQQSGQTDQTESTSKSTQV